MKKKGITRKLKGHLVIIIGFGAISLTLFISLLTTVVRARTLDIDNIFKQLEIQKEVQAYNPHTILKFVEQRRLNHNTEFDFRCLSWSTNQASSGWMKEDDHYVFFIDYYVPPDKKTIICTTPALTTALTAVVDKPLLYEIYPTDYGLHIRIIIGFSEAVEPCKRLTGNVNCVNFILLQQASVKYEP